MYPIKCIIVEDEPLAVKVLEDYISELPYLRLVGVFKDAIDSLAYLANHQVDLIFLDIHLPKLKGMSFLRTLSNPPEVIITTAYHQYALEGYEMNVRDYLMKPIDFDRFLQAVNKIKAFGINEASAGRDYLFVNVQKKKVKVLLSDILFIESQREYVRIATMKKELIAKMSTREMENLLPSGRFRRIHRSFIVSVDKIDVLSNDGVEVQGTLIPVGRNYTGLLQDLIK